MAPSRQAFTEGEKQRHPELFEPDKKIDRRTRTRVVPMQVLNLGFMRTGTTSIQTALDILGYNCYHSVLIYSNLSDVDMWGEALDAKLSCKGKIFGREEWDQLLGDYSAASDVPVICFAEDLIAAYPEAKVILVERNIDKWYKSFNDTVVKYMYFTYVKWLVILFDPPLLRYSTMTFKWVRGWLGANSQDEMRAKAKDKYREHYELVRKVTPKDRLLEFKLQDGWKPLCEFLHKPIPDVPFPHVNDTQTLDERISIASRLLELHIRQKMIRYAAINSIVLLVGVLAWSVWN